MAIPLTIDGKLNPAMFGSEKITRDRLIETTTCLVEGSINLSVIITGGVYILLAVDRVLYVGQTACLASRIGNHFHSEIPFSRIEFIPLADEKARLELERQLIVRFNPPLNKTMRHRAFNRSKDANPRPYGDYSGGRGKGHGLIDTEFDE